MSKHQDSQQIPLFPELQPEAPSASLAKWGRGQAEASPLRLVSSGPGRVSQAAEEASRDRRIEIDLLNRVKYF